jgi:hypothetical protein
LNLGNIPVVKYVLGPGPRAKGNLTSFYQDETFLQSEGDKLAQRGLEHIGIDHCQSKRANEPKRGEAKKHCIVELFSLV